MCAPPPPPLRSEQLGSESHPSRGGGVPSYRDLTTRVIVLGGGRMSRQGGLLKTKLKQRKSIGVEFVHRSPTPTGLFSLYYYLLVPYTRYTGMIFCIILVAEWYCVLFFLQLFGVVRPPLLAIKSVHFFGGGLCFCFEINPQGEGVI